MTSQPEDPVVYHGGDPKEPFREERDRDALPVEDEALFAPSGMDDRQLDQPGPSEAEEEDALATDQPVVDEPHSLR